MFVGLEFQSPLHSEQWLLLPQGPQNQLDSFQSQMELVKISVQLKERANKQWCVLKIKANG